MQDVKWVVCAKGVGRKINKMKYNSHFPKNSVGIFREAKEGYAIVWLIGSNETWSIPMSDIAPINVAATGDKCKKKICNICHCLFDIEQFAKNQRNAHGIVRRPSCLQCRTDIDKRAPKSQQAKLAEKNRPAKGTPYECPICCKRSIVGITAKVVADHNHHTGDIRDFICDSCNTGLGRFKNGEDYLNNAIAYLEQREKQ